MNAMKCEAPNCESWAYRDDNEGWLSLSRADWPDGGGRWEHERYFCTLTCLDVYVWQEDQERAAIEAEVDAEEAVSA